MWFESYLKNRTQYVEIDGSKSEPYVTNVSVPQGGVLSALLFILFTNDIVQSTKQLKFSIYADDTSLVIAIDREQYDQTLKTELDKVIEWFSANLLLINVNKTEYTFFGPHYKKKFVKDEHDSEKFNFILEELHEIAPKYELDEFIISDEGNIITPSGAVKYLGMYIDSKLDFTYHISILTCKISRMTGIFWKSDLDIKIKKIIYHSLVESHLNYGIVLWCSEFSKTLTTDSNESQIPSVLKSIITVQNKIIRAIFRKPKFDKKQKTYSYTETSPLYKELFVLKIKDLYFYNLAILAHDYFNNVNFPTKLHENFTSHATNTDRQTRSLHYNLSYDKPRTLKTYRKPTIASTMFWNSLPTEIKSIKPKSTFKHN